MIYEHAYNNNKICNGCKHLKLDNPLEGECICKYNKVKNKKRHVTDKKCSFKEGLK